MGEIKEENKTVIHLLSILQEGVSVYLHLSLVERRRSPWKGRQSIIRQHRDTQDKLYTHTPKDFWRDQLTYNSCPEYSERTPVCTGRTCQTFGRKTPDRDSNAGPSCSMETEFLNGPLLVPPTSPTCTKTHHDTDPSLE